VNYGIDYLQRLVEAVDEYEECFDEWMSTQVESDPLQSRGLLPTVWRREGVSDADIRQREVALAEVAGLAAIAVDITGARIVVQGLGALDPLSNWSTMTQPKAVFSPRDIRLTIANVKGRLEALIRDAEAAEDSAIPVFSPANLHPIVWQAAAPQWTIHEYRIAISEAATALTNYWREKLHRLDVDGTQFWQQSLSPTPPTLGNPKIVWPGDDRDKTKKSMKNGLPSLATSLKDLAVGMALTSRNVSAHAQRLLTEQEAMEQLAAYSFLARLLDMCEVQFAEGDER